MRQTISTLNRVWLIVIGLVALIAGVLSLLISTRQLAPLSSALGATITAPENDAKAIPSGAGSTLDSTCVFILIAAAAVVLALLGVLWLAAQVPRTNQATPFRLHDNAEHGLTRCAPGVLTNAVVAQIEAHPDVQSASAVLRGTADTPDLTIKVTAGERTNIPQLLAMLESTVARDLGMSLDTQVRRLGVLVEVDTIKTRSDRIVVAGSAANPQRSAPAGQSA